MTNSYRHPIEARMTYGPPRLSLAASILVISRPFYAILGSAPVDYLDALALAVARPFTLAVMVRLGSQQILGEPDKRENDQPAKTSQRCSQEYRNAERHL